MTDNIIETFGLSKIYYLKGKDKHVNALDDVNISIKKGDRNKVSEIIVSPKKYLPAAPILESLDPKIEFQYPIKGDKFDFIYKRVEMANVWANTYASKPPKSRFRLQLIVLPEN